MIIFAESCFLHLLLVLFGDFSVANHNAQTPLFEDEKRVLFQVNSKAGLKSFTCSDWYGKGAHIEIYLFYNDHFAFSGAKSVQRKFQNKLFVSFSSNETVLSETCCRISFLLPLEQWILVRSSVKYSPPYNTKADCRDVFGSAFTFLV